MKKMLAEVGRKDILEYIKYGDSKEDIKIELKTKYKNYIKCPKTLDEVMCRKACD